VRARFLEAVEGGSGELFHHHPKLMVRTTVEASDGTEFKVRRKWETIGDMAFDNLDDLDNFRRMQQLNMKSFRKWEKPETPHGEAG